jgi:hypothetical protein
MRIEKNTHNTHEIRIGQFADEPAFIMIMIMKLVSVLKHGKLSPKSEGNSGNRECDCVTYEKMALILGSVSWTRVLCYCNCGSRESE